MTENMKNFLAEVSKNEELKEKAGKAAKEELIEIAKEAGYTLTEEDFAKPSKEELSDDELMTVAGGRGFCFVFGFGSAHDDDVIDCLIAGWEEDMLCTIVGF